MARVAMVLIRLCDISGCDGDHYMTLNNLAWRFHIITSSLFRILARPKIRDDFAASARVIFKTCHSMRVCLFKKIDIYLIFLNDRSFK